MYNTYIINNLLFNHINMTVCLSLIIPCYNEEATCQKFVEVFHKMGAPWPFIGLSGREAFPAETTPPDKFSTDKILGI